MRRPARAKRTVAPLPVTAPVPAPVTVPVTVPVFVPVFVPVTAEGPRRVPGRPPRFSPQLATLASVAPAGDDWLHEIKLDGYRIGCHIDHGCVTLLSRRENDWTADFSEIAAAAARLPVKTAMLDGEAAVMLADGRTSFHALQRAVAGGSRAGLMFFAFDLIHLDGEDVGALPIEERKDRLARLLKSAPPDLPLRFSDHVAGNGPAVFAEACRMGLEGIVSKRRGESYQPGRSSGWLKVKGELRQEFVIGGFTSRVGSLAGASSRNATGEIGALLCGTYADDGTLTFAGKVGTGFSAQGAAELWRRLQALTDDRCPFAPPPDGLSRRGARWVRPALVAEIAFRNWTDDDKIRHATFAGLRTDKAPSSVRRERDELKSAR